MNMSGQFWFHILAFNLLDLDPNLSRSKNNFHSSYSFFLHCRKQVTQWVMAISKSEIFICWRAGGEAKSQMFVFFILFQGRYPSLFLPPFSPAPCTELNSSLSLLICLSWKSFQPSFRSFPISALRSPIRWFM